MEKIQGHYGLEFALAHLGEDMTEIFKTLESEQRENERKTKGEKDGN